MKRQLDRLKGKRLVTGDPNLMTKDEICINATPNGVEVKEIGTDGSIKDIANGGGASNGEVKEWYYRFSCRRFVDDNDLNESDALESIEAIEMVTSPIARIVYYSSTNSSEPDIYYESVTTTPRKIDLDTDIYFKYSENYYLHLIANNKPLVFKGTLEKRLEDYNKFASLNGADAIDFSKYFTPMTKEEYYSILTKEELTLDDLLNNIP